MLTKIRKRDGRVICFEQNKIKNAIFRAAQSVGGADCDRAEFLAKQVVEQAQTITGTPTVEEIQDIVEKVLIENGHAKTAKAYILYRNKRTEIRNFKSYMLNAQKMVQEYLGGEDWRINENSNMNYSLQGLNNHVISSVTSKYWLEKVYPREIRVAHETGDIHIHDLSLLAPYCCGWDIQDILLHGFKGAKQKVVSGPAKHFRSALGQICNFFYTLQGEAAGAQALSSFDTYLAPFIRYDNLSYREVKQAMQEFIFNCNIPTRVGFQSPFLNITLDVTASSVIAHEPVIVGGQFQEETYGQFQEEMNMINRAFCEVMMAGDANGRIFTFPIPTYNVTKEFFNNPIINDIMAMTAKYGIPYFANFINSDLRPEDVRSMCCRLRIDHRELKKRGGGLFGANPLTGSIGVVTLNLPRIGYKASSESDFFDRVKVLASIAKKSFRYKRDILEKLTEIDLYPYSSFYLRAVKQRFNRYWDNHFNTIGIIGTNECLLNFIGKNITTVQGQNLAGKILDYLRELMVDYQEETGQMFNLEATPGESTSYRLAKLDKELYPDIITAGEEEPYYTNSTQLPVNFDEDVFRALDLQDNLQTQYTGGTVFHAYLGERIEDLSTCQKLIKTILGNYQLPYISVTPTFSICNEHGYLDGEQFICPYCGRDAEVWSRVVGFYRPVQNWNKGKQEEYRQRKEWKVAGKEDPEDVYYSQTV